jgi:hypothetical protein
MLKQVIPNKIKLAQQIHRAAIQFELATIKRYLSQGASFNAVINSDTALTAALRQFHHAPKDNATKTIVIKVIIDLLQPELIKHKGREGKTAIDIAIEKKLAPNLLYFICAKQFLLSSATQSIDTTLVDALIKSENALILSLLIPSLSLRQVYQLCQYITPIAVIDNDMELYSICIRSKEDIAHRILPKALKLNSLTTDELHIAKAHANTLFKLFTEILSPAFQDKYYYYNFLEDQTTLSWLKQSTVKGSAIHQILHSNNNLRFFNVFRQTKNRYDQTIEQLIQNEHDAFGQGQELKTISNRHQT